MRHSQNRGSYIAAAFFIRSNGKVIYLSAASSDLSRTNRAMFALVSRFINDNSELVTLDFEDLQSIVLQDFMLVLEQSRVLLSRLYCESFTLVVETF